MSHRGPLRLPERPALLLLSALLTALAFPPFELLFPSFLGLTPFAVWVARIPAGPEGRSEAWRGGFLLGALLYSLLLYWLATALLRFTPLAIPAFLLPVVLFAGITAAVALGIHQAVRRLGLPIWLALPLFWTAGEWLRGHLGPLSFPWLGLGDSLAAFPGLAGAADLVGSRGLSAWLALCSGLVAEAVLRRRPAWLTARPTDGRGPGRIRGTGSPLVPLVALVAAIVLAGGYSAWRWETLELRSTDRVAVLQPDVPQEVKRRGAPAVDSAMAATDRLVEDELAGAGPLDLVVLPETAFPIAVGGGERAGGGGPRVERFVADLAARLDASVLYGAHGIAARGREGRLHNSALLAGPEGDRRGAYHKRRLVPLFERSLIGAGGGFVPGRPDPDPLAAGSARFGTLVCWEVIFPGLGRSYRLAGADFLVNVTNDAWFGRGGSPWRRTSALWQHPAHLVMRAIENRVGAVRSANTGISMTVDPLGRVRHRTSLFEPAVFAAHVVTTRGTTFYARYGDFVGWGCALAALGVALASGVWPRERRPSSGGGAP